MKWLGVVAGCLLSSSAFANIVTTENLIANSTFQPVNGADARTGAREEWDVFSGEFRFPDRTGEIDGYDGQFYAAWGGSTANAYMEQFGNLQARGINIDLVDTGLVTMDMGMYINSSYNDRDRSRMYVTFFDEAGAQAGAITQLGYYDLSSWGYREVNDVKVPELARDFRVVIHNDRLDGTGNSTGVALPSMTFSLEDNEESRQALNTFGYLQQSVSDVPVGMLGGFGFGMLLLARRKR